MAGEKLAVAPGESFQEIVQLTGAGFFGHNPAPFLWSFFLLMLFCPLIIMGIRALFLLPSTFGHHKRNED